MAKCSGSREMIRMMNKVLERGKWVGFTVENGVWNHKDNSRNMIVMSNKME